MKTNFDGLVKWTILLKDEKINRHIIYTEEKFACVCAENENKDDFKHIQYDKFFKMVGNVYSDIVKRWLKIGSVEVFYKGWEGQNLDLGE